MDMLFKPGIGIRYRTKAAQKHCARRRFLVCRVFFFFLLPLLCASGTCAGELQAASENAGIRIIILSEAQVAGERILMGQVAEIAGATRRIQEKIEALDLGAAPRPGKERRVPGRLIASTLGSCEWLPKDTRTTIPDWVVVKGAYQSISDASLEGVFKTYIERGTGGDETAVSNVKIRGLKPLPLGEIALTPLGHGGDYIKGSVTLRLAVIVAGEDQGQVSISGWVDRYSQAVCSTRPIERGMVLTAGDVTFRRINVSKTPDRTVFNLNEVLGKQLRTRLRAGDCLREHMLREPFLVVKGDHVKIVAQSAGLSVSTMGIAKADGARGDQVRVENAVSEKTVVGRVLDRGIVEVLF